MTTPYDAAPEAWVQGPARVYARLGEAMLDHSPVALEGAAVLDVGAGTAVVAAAALRRGASTAVASDLAARMLRHRDGGIPALLADAARLPLRDRSFDLAAAGFCLSHLDDPAAALAEWRRVAGAVVASAFGPGAPHPAKTLVDEAMAELGFRPPDWYRRVKDQSPAVEDPEKLGALVAGAGYAEVRVDRFEVDAGLATPDDVVRWRLGMGHLAPWVASLSDDRRREAYDAAREAVTGLGPVWIDVLVVSGR